MGMARAPSPTITFSDEYCAAYCDLSDDVRNFEHSCPYYGCSPLGAKAQSVYAWDEAPRFSGFSFMVF